MAESESSHKTSDVHIVVQYTVLHLDGTNCIQRPAGRPFWTTHQNSSVPSTCAGIKASDEIVMGVNALRGRVTIKSGYTAALQAIQARFHRRTTKKQSDAVLSGHKLPILVSHGTDAASCFPRIRCDIGRTRHMENGVSMHICSPKSSPSRTENRGLVGNFHPKCTLKNGSELTWEELIWMAAPPTVNRVHRSRASRTNEPVPPPLPLSEQRMFPGSLLFRWTGVVAHRDEDIRREDPEDKVRFLRWRIRRHKDDGKK
ncbi:hypothetical protein F5146DRAFT_1004894 [Armillaria mellea]|nr:hypothetical protein F5146DRAFT_1004894 [Armillaria mellea]